MTDQWMHQLLLNLLLVCVHYFCSNSKSNLLILNKAPKAQPAVAVEPPKPPRVVVAPWRIKETAPVFVPNEIDEGLGEDDMAIDDD
jgi:hypothetical protein